MRDAKRVLRFHFWTHDGVLRAGIVQDRVGYLPFHTFATRNVAHRWTPLLRYSRLLCFCGYVGRLS